jgi:hypothetical protein
MNMNRLIAILALLIPLISSAQLLNRDYIKREIENWGSCKNVAITQHGGDIALSGKNAYAYMGPIPSGLTESLDELSSEGELIDDVVLTEDGIYIVLFGRNGFRYAGVPYSLEQKMKEYNSNNDLILAITVNDQEDWIIIGDKISASSQRLMDMIRNGMKKYGALWSAHVTNDGLALVYEKGFQFMGNVPEILKQHAEQAKFDVFRIKFTADGAFFIADRKGHYDYRM